MFKIAKYKELKRKYSTVEKEIRRFDPNIKIESATTPPSSWYLNKEFYDFEMNAIFKKNWIGLETDFKIKKTGDFICGKFINQPYVIIRNDKSEDKAFYNICSHHASKIIQNENGNCKQLVCPYHGWEYSLNGQLVKLTSMRGIQNFNVKNFGLKSIKLEKWANLFFLNFEKENKSSLSDILGPVSKSLKERNFDPSFKDMHFVQRKEYTIKCNWKVFVDNYNDGGYHIPFGHKKLDSVIEMKNYSFDSFEKCYIQTVTGSESVKSQRLGEHAVYAHIFPNLFINRYGPWLDINVLIPTGPEECVVRMDWFIDEKMKDEKQFIEESLKDSELVQEEDIFLCENVMAGLKSDAYDVGRYVPLKETPCYNFHVDLFNELIKSI